jgi:hypothetical protein
LTIAWSRLAITRSDFGISAIFASTSLSPSALPLREPRRSAFSSRERSFIASRSSAVNRVARFVGFLSAIGSASVDRVGGGLNHVCRHNRKKARGCGPSL